MYIMKPSKQRTAEDRRAVRNTVADIIDDVCENGDAALGNTVRSSTITTERISGFHARKFRKPMNSSPNRSSQT